MGTMPAAYVLQKATYFVGLNVLFCVSKFNLQHMLQHVYCFINFSVDR